MKRIFWKRRLVIFFVVTVGFPLLLVFACFFYPQQVLTVDSGGVKADALIVLGGGSERPERAAELFQANVAPLIICSGYGDNLVNQACLIKAGVPKPSVLLEPESRSTRENAKFTITMLRARHCQSAIIVTSWYHSRRALHCFEHYAPDIRFYSRPSYFGYPRGQWQPKHIGGFIKIEYAKLLGYWLCYGVCPL